MKHQLITSLIFFSLTLPYGASVQAQLSTIDPFIQTSENSTRQSENECKKYSCFFHVRGTITNQTVNDAKNFLEANKNSEVTVNFDSLGGDVRAAVELGRIIRKYVATTMLMAGDCASACVIAFVGGANRTTVNKSPKFGIHTPYSTDTRSTTYGYADSRFKMMSSLVAQYLKDMNIPAGLYDEMLRYSAESMHIMTNEELSRYHVLGTDPAEQDRRDANSARSLGLNKQTFLSRKALTKIQCDKYSVTRPTQETIFQYFTCRDQIMHAK